MSQEYQEITMEDVGPIDEPVLEPEPVQPPEWQGKQITRRVVDGSYVISKGGPYHVPNEGEYTELWAEVDAFAKGHPEQVTEEYPYVPPPLAPEEVQAALERAINERLNAFAGTRGYDDIDAAISRYANSHIAKYKAESDYCSWALSETWVVYYAIMAKVKAGERPMPLEHELFAELPQLEWPGETEE